MTIVEHGAETARGIVAGLGRFTKRLPSVVLGVALTAAMGGPTAAFAQSAQSGHTGSIVAGTSASPRLLRVRTLIKANVLELAERIMEEQGPPLLPNGEWLNWERQLWTLYASRGKWLQLIERIQAIPPAFPLSVKREAEQHVVTAYIALGEGRNARRRLRQMLLSDSLSERDKRSLRLHVIETYVADGLDEEANIAAASFQQDYRAQDPSWLLLSAQIALGSGYPDRAVNLLAPLDEPGARVLRLYARLVAGSIDPDQVRDKGRSLLQQPGMESMRKQLLAVMIDSANRSRSLVEKVDLLERYMLEQSQPGERMLHQLPRFDGEDLLLAYQALASATANQAGYLRGEEEGWGRLAEQISVEQGETRRALWATISLAVRTENARALAVDRFTSVLMDDSRSALVQDLFGRDAPLGELQLEPATGLRLSNQAIEDGDMQLAANANATISGPPPGMDYGDWLLQSGRIAIIAGRPQQGAAQLEKWIQSRDRLSPDQTDAILQPVFDLQTVDQHRLAISLLEQIEQRSPGGKYTREIAFWLAESYSATRQYVKAADYFLFSALQKDNGFDQWGESARYRAADSLLQGNFFGDARTLFEDLLARATEDNRRQQLLQKLQDLRLRESSMEGEAQASR